KINNSESSNLGQWLLNSTGFDPSTAIQIVSGMGTLEVLFGIFIGVGLLTRPSSIFMILILVSSQAMFGFIYTQGPAIWKDPGLLGLAILLLLSGAGKFSIDYLITKRNKIYRTNILKYFLK
ncbi:MAG TPA: DoxX family membrane protein, partial [Nitrososphaeraceae archaeon]